MTTSHRLRVGLIGAAGRWGPSAHIPAIQRLPQTELYAVCTAHEDTARAAAQKYSVELAYQPSNQYGFILNPIRTTVRPRQSQKIYKFESERYLVLSNYSR